MSEKKRSVLIISTSFKEQEMIEDYARQISTTDKRPMPSFRTTASFGQDAAWWSKNAPDMLIINLPEESLLQSQFLMKLKVEVPKTLPLLLICEIVSSGVMQMTTVFNKVRIVKGILDAEKLYQGFSDLLAEYQPGRQQAAPRFPTNQLATVSRLKESATAEVVLKNMSNTGAYFESKVNPLGLAIDQLVKIRVTIPGIREYSFEAKIVWFKNLGENGFGFGTTFINNE